MYSPRAGFGAGAEAPCGTSPTYQEANDNTYGNMLCGYFAANCSIVAWSGKGLYVNSPTAGTAETLPFYYQSATGVFPYTTDWDQVGLACCSAVHLISEVLRFALFV